MTDDGLESATGYLFNVRIPERLFPHRCYQAESRYHDRNHNPVYIQDRTSAAKRDHDAPGMLISLLTLKFKYFR